MNCLYCGSRIFDSDRCCVKCGAPIEHIVICNIQENEELLNQSGFEEFSFIAGTLQTLNFKILTPDDIPVINMDIIWQMIHCGQSNVIINKKANTNNNGIAIICLEERETENLSGKFIHQIEFTSKNKYRLRQGIINIIIHWTKDNKT